MACGEIKELLSEYVDNTLRPETKTLVDEHLSTCKDCQQELASLKALVRELGSLKTLEPPKDFLDQLHGRMEQRSRFSKILRTLFVPMRVKIPLELASAAVMAILIFSVLHVQQDPYRLAEAPVSVNEEKATEESALDSVGRSVSKDDKPSLAYKSARARHPAEAPVGLKQERTVEKGSLDSVESRVKKEAYKPSPAYETAKAKELSDEREPLELVLLIKKNLPRRAYGPGEALKTAPVQEENVRGRFSATKAKPEGQLERDQEVDDSLPRVTKIIESLGGRVVNIEHEKGTDRPQSIHMEIPAKQINTLYNQLRELGELQTPPQIISGIEQEFIQVRIRLLPPG
jgi:hypothetical protein